MESEGIMDTASRTAPVVRVTDFTNRDADRGFIIAALDTGLALDLKFYVDAPVTIKYETAPPLRRRNSGKSAGPC
jgi:hypothetical protein